VNTPVRQAQKKAKANDDRLTKRWQQTERLQDENARLRADLDQLLERVRGELAPVQAEEAEAARELILHLLPFLRRKSLTRWQRDEIRDWVEDQLEIVTAAGLMDATLEDALARDWALQRGIEIDEDCDQSAAEQVQAEARREQETLELDDEGFESTREGTQADIEAWVEREVEARVHARFGSTAKPTREDAIDDLFAAELDEAERERAEEIKRFRQQAQRAVREEIEARLGERPNDPDQQATADDRGDGPIDDEAAPSKPALDKGVLERLFRRTANVLHPDKEQEERRRADKQSLMGTLLKARKNEDILTVIKLYQEHAGGSPAMEVSDENELLTALEQQIEHLQDEQEAIINQSPAHASIYRELYRRSRKQVDREIAKLKQEARQRAELARRCVREVTTLKALKPVLEERREERRSALLDGLFIVDVC
jgi:hypothetical protein